MKEGQTSETANISAVMRAAHRLLDPPPWLFDDTWAGRLTGLSSDSALHAAIDTFQRRLLTFGTPAQAATWIRVSRLGVALRARYTEDELAAAIERGTEQYVILGAGLDSFAYRRSDLLARLCVFEVDHPATQHHKQRQLQALRAQVPSTLEYVPFDFQTQPSLFTALVAAGFDPTRPAFFSFLGVTWYLSSTVLDRTLRELAAAAPGSELVVDYLLPENHLAEPERTVLRMLAAMAASQGEPGGTCFTPGQMLARLRQVGFSTAVDFGSPEAHTRYCRDRSDGLQIPQLLHIAKALVS